MGSAAVLKALADKLEDEADYIRSRNSLTESGTPTDYTERAQIEVYETIAKLLRSLNT